MRLSNQLAAQTAEDWSIGRSLDETFKERWARTEKLWSAVDVDYIAFAVLMAVFGIVGITATVNVSPNVLALPSCNCIPSPAARLQELSIVLFAISLVIAPVGLLRRNSSVSAGVHHQNSTAAQETASIPPMRSGGLFFLGVSLIVFGVALVAVPSFLVLGNELLVLEGMAMVALGATLAYRGGRSS
jgi:hypothetical protein